MKATKIETTAIRTQADRTQFQEHSVPLYLTSSFVFEDADEMNAAFSGELERNIYSRFTNPNTAEFVDKMVKMEGAEAGVTFATGMSAVFSTLAALLCSGDHLISARAVFGSTHGLLNNFLPRWNISHSYFDHTDLDAIESLIQPETKLIFAESPTNPAVDIVDLEKLAEIARKHDLLLIVDNCFATPYLQNPIHWGADLVIHSATKLIDGQGRVLGGVTVGKKDLIREIFLFARNTGPALSPFNAWILSKSLETLPVRLDRHCQNALEVARFLENHDATEKVKYPFLESHPQYEIARKLMRQGGNVISFVIKGGLEAGKAFIDALQLCSRTANLGDSRSIVTHPASTTHGRLSPEDQLEAGITPGLVRISVGLEHPDDIIRDLHQALDTAAIATEKVLITPAENNFQENKKI